MRVVALTPIALLLLLAAVYLLTPRATLAPETPRRGYLDAHAHLACIGAGNSGCYVNPDLADSFRFGFYLRGSGVTREELREHGDALVARRLSRRVSASRYVSGAVILALDGVVRDDAIDRSATRIYVPNDFVARMAQRYDNLEYGASVHPDRSDWRERLVAAKRSGAVLVKWRPAAMDIDPADPRYTGYYQTLVELELPLLVHVGNDSAFGEVNDALGDPRKLALPLEQGVTVIAAHLGTTGAYGGRPSHRQLLSMMEDHTNLYADISSLTQIDRVGYLVEALQAPGTAERMLYGSSWPLHSLPVVSSFFHWPDVNLSTAKAIQGIRNELDRDVMLKRALGVPPQVFERAGSLLAR